MACFWLMICSKLVRYALVFVEFLKARCEGVAVFMVVEWDDDDDELDLFGWFATASNWVWLNDELRDDDEPEPE